MTRNIVLGPPGTGKTTHLLSLVDEALTNGIPPDQICFLTFSRKGAEEAISRAVQKFNLSADQFPYFRTVHSLCYKQLGLSRSRVLQRDHVSDLGDKLGLELSGAVNIGEDLFSTGRGDDKLLFLENLSRTRCVSIREQFDDYESDSVSWAGLDQLSRALAAYKQQYNLIDYTDMLSEFCSVGFAPQFELLLVDEAQDLSALQWKVVNKLEEGSKSVNIAGDDDQGIFRWAGADVETFIELEGTVHILDQSYRVPKEIQSLALSIISTVEARRDKSWTARPGTDGKVNHVTSPEDIDLSAGTWLLLARNSYMLKELERVVRLQGYAYDMQGKSPLSNPAVTAIRVWETMRRGKALAKAHVRSALAYVRKADVDAFADTDSQEWTLKELFDKGWIPSTGIWHVALDGIDPDDREYLISVLRNGESLTKTPRIKLATMHGSKGGEADNVVLLSDVAPRTFDEMMDRPDDEARVFYVGITRARETLYIVTPNTGYYYDL